MSSFFDYLSKSSKAKLNTKTEAELKAERNARPGRKISVWGQNKSTGRAARQNAGRPGEQVLQPRASAESSNKAHNNPKPRTSEEKHHAKPTKRDERRMGYVNDKICAQREKPKSKQLGPTPPPQVVPATKKPQQRNDFQGSIGLGTQQKPTESPGIAMPRNATSTQVLKSPTGLSKSPPPRDRRSWTIASGIGSGHAWGTGGGNKGGGLRYSQPQPMKQSDMEHDMHVGEAYGKVDYIYSQA